MSIVEKKDSLFNIVLRYLPYKITQNLKRIYLDIDMESNRMILTAYYEQEPSELEKELLDDIATDSNAPIPDFFVDYQIKLTKEYDKNEKHEFVVFSVFEEI
jgi:hypothetical protein